MTDTHALPATFDIPESFAERLARFGTAALRLLPAETAHELGMALLASGYMDRFFVAGLERPISGFKTKVPGIGDLSHPIGLAAGFDKNARAPRAFARMGFSFIEVGTVTPRPQPGNPKPRLFRVPQYQAIINRMGFNSDGAHAVATRLKNQKWDHDVVPLGINVGKNKDTGADQALDDYVQSIQMFSGEARYFVVNISSPNTPGLRDLASPNFIKMLASALGQTRYQVWVKLDPDMGVERFQDLVETIAAEGFQGLVLSNTHRVEWPQAGGLSGHPLAHLSAKSLELAYAVHKGSLPMVGSGGILSGHDVFERLSRGACAVQIYTALVYRGPWVVLRMLTELASEMRLRGFTTVDQVVGSHYTMG